MGTPNDSQLARSTEGPGLMTAVYSGWTVLWDITLYLWDLTLTLGSVRFYLNGQISSWCLKNQSIGCLVLGNSPHYNKYVN